MALPAYKAVSNTAGHSATTGSLTVAWPTGHAANDLALLFVESAGGTADPTLSTAAGFVEIGRPASTGNTTAGTKLAVFWCRATGGSMTSPVIAAATDHQFAVMVTFSGVATTGNPIHDHDVNVKPSASTSATSPAIYTSLADCLIVSAISWDLDGTGARVTAYTNGSLASITERFDAGTASGLGGGIAVYTGSKATAGNVTTGTFTVTSSINALKTIALKPVPSNFPPSVALNTTDAGSINDDTPTLDFTGTDPSSNDIRYHIQIDTTNTFDGQQP